MKFTFVFLLVLEIAHLKGEVQRTDQSGHIILKLDFHPFYNSHVKYCCKLAPGRCDTQFFSTGFTTDFLKGRVTKTESNGWIEFKISNAQFADAGQYRCFVQATQHHIYRDYVVEVLEVPGQHWPQPAQTTTLKPTYMTKGHEDPTGPVLIQEDHSDGPRVPWSLALPLAATVSITVLLFIMSLITAVCCRIKAKCNQLNKSGDDPCEPVKQEEPEVSAVVYTAVDFRAHRKPTELYTNHGTHGDRAEHAEMVEYATLAVKR